MESGRGRGWERCGKKRERGGDMRERETEREGEGRRWEKEG